MRQNAGHFVWQNIKEILIEQYEIASSLKNIKYRENSELNIKMELGKL